MKLFILILIIIIVALLVLCGHLSDEISKCKRNNKKLEAKNSQLAKTNRDFHEQITDLENEFDDLDEKYNDLLFHPSPKYFEKVLRTECELKKVVARTTYLPFEVSEQEVRECLTTMIFNQIENHLVFTSNKRIEDPKIELETMIYIVARRN